MLRKAGQTAGPIGLKFCVDTLKIFFSSKFFSTGSAGYFSQYPIECSLKLETCLQILFFVIQKLDYCVTFLFLQQNIFFYFSREICIYLHAASFLFVLWFCSVQRVHSFTRLSIIWLLPYPLLFQFNKLFIQTYEKSIKLKRAKI